MNSTRVLRYGMVGGGPGAFIGAVHRRAAAFDGLARLVAGAFSSDAARSAAHGAELGLDPARVYPDFATMAEREAARPSDDRIDLAVVVTPNHLHYPATRAFLEAGIPVVCDKPLATRLADAEALCRLAAERDLLCAVTYNYTGYPLIKQARALVADGALGTIRRVVAEYTQGWLSERLEADGQKQAAWRTDPEQAGAGALGDIGTHAFNLMHYVSGLVPHQLIADVHTFVPGRRVDDDASVLFRYAGGARGVLTCTQVAAGEENRLSLRVHGSRGSLHWSHERPTELHFRDTTRALRVFTPGTAGLHDSALRASRLPPGHPEAFHDAFANVYANVLRTLRARLDASPPDPLDLDFPTVRDGARGVHFIETALHSAQVQQWVDAAYSPPGG